MAEAPTKEPTGGPAAVAVAAAVATRTATPLVPHRAATTPTRRLRSCGGRSRPPQATTTAFPPSHLDFATCSSPTSSSLWGSTLVLRLYQETVHNFILLFMPPCGPHLTPLATGSLERSLLVFSTPGGLTGNDLSRLFFICTNTSQAATCTCNT
jgi:hypothetical protein